jgi:hypothetical protein
MDDLLTKRECPICLDLENNDIVHSDGPKNKIQYYITSDMVTTTCQHTFHKKCIMMWFVSSANVICPMCRAPCNPLAMNPPIMLSDFFSLRASDSSVYHDEQFMAHLKYIATKYFHTDLRTSREVTLRDILEMLFVFLIVVAMFSTIFVLMSMSAVVRVGI